MTPAEYIAAQQRGPRKPIIPPFDREATISALQQQGVARAEAEKAVDQKPHGLDYAQNLLSGLRTKLPPEVFAAFTRGILATGEVEDSDPDMKTVMLESGYPIVVNSGLHRFLYRIARIFSTRASPDTSVPAMEFRETVRLMTEAFWWCEMAGRAFGPNYPVSRDQIFFASKLTSKAMEFLFCHEIAHAMNDASHNVRLVQVVEPDGTATVHVPEIPENDEHYADTLGAELAMGLATRSGAAFGKEDIITYAGIEFALQVYATMERLGMKVSDVEHPPAPDRLERIRATLHARCASDEVWSMLTSLARQIESIFEAISLCINHPGENAAYFDSEAARVVEELDELLENAPTDFGSPGQVAFDMAAMQIFERGYPHEFLKKVAQAAADFYDVQKNQMLLTDTAILARIGKLRLLLNFANHWAPEPARTILLETLNPGGRPLDGFFDHK